MSSTAPDILQDKVAFFQSLPTQNASTEALICNKNLSEHVLKAAQAKDHRFLSEHYRLIELQVKTLKPALLQEDISLDDALRNQYALYLQYCEAMLETYRKNRGEPIELIDNIHDNIIFFHAYRILFTFVFLTNKQVITLLNSAGLLSKLYALLAPFASFEKSMTLLSGPTPILYALSVGLLAIRFLIDIARVLKHTFFPTEEEKALSMLERFTNELYKYRINLMNDFLWCTLNAFGNYPDAFGLSPVVANFMTLGGLCIDICLLVYRHQFTLSAYQGEFEQITKDNTTPEVIKKAQQQALELQHTETVEELNLSFVAGSVLITGCTLFLTVPVAIVFPIGTFLCVVGTALYLAAGHYAAYKKEGKHIEQLIEADKIDSEEMRAAKDAQQKALDAGIASFAKDTCMPILFVATLAVCWPIGLGLFIAYTGYQLLSQAAQEEAKQDCTPKLKFA